MRLRLTPRRLVTFFAALALSAFAVPPATASHLEQPRKGLREVGFHPLLNTGFNTDIWAHATQDGRLFAYSGTWGTLIGDDPCPSETDNPAAPTKSGVKIVDATDPARPRLVKVLGTVPGAQNLDIKVQRIETPAFTGDLLTHSLEPCGALLGLALLQGGPVPDIPSEQTGFQLYDVSDPANPVKLGAYHNGGLGTHNHYLFGRPDLGRAFVAAVFNEQSVLTGIRGELQLVDVSNSAFPTLVSTWELADAPVPAEDLCKERGTHLPACVLHDVWVSDDGKTAYLSFWDAGLILLDITDPANPVFKGQIQSGSLEEEGNTHAAVPFSAGKRNFVIVGDEDFVGPGPSPHVSVNQAPAGAQVAAGDHFAGTEMSNTRPLAEGAVGPAPLLKADDDFGCVWTTAASIGSTLFGGSWLGVARRGGTCPLFQMKVTSAETAGADGLVVVNDGPGSVSGLAASTTMPAMMVPKDEGDRLIASIDPASPGALRVTLELLPTAQIDPWGFMRVIDVTDANPANWRQVSTFKAPHVDSTDQPPESVFSAHNPIVGPDGLVYFAWYTDGVRVLSGSPKGSFKEVAWFVPLPSDHANDLDSDPHGVQEDNIGFWGSKAVVHPTTGDLLVFNSDFNRGIYILKKGR